MSKEIRAKERWSSRTGIILAVASGAIGLGNFLRFPGQAAQNGGGAFMLPYIISFIFLGIPVVMTEWIMGRMGSQYGHSAPFIFRSFMSGIPSRITGAIGIAIPLLIYVYYVFIEAWCLAYAWFFLTGQVDIGAVSTAEVVNNASTFFMKLTGANANGASFESSILVFALGCFFINFYLVSKGLSKGLEAFSKLAIPLMGIFSVIMLIRVLTLDGIGEGLGKMWNPDWSALLKPDVWIAAAGQIFFSLSAGFGIALVFSSYLTKKDDVVLSSLSSASINEFAEVGLGGMITIPVAFLFLGAAINSFGTFGMGFIALPSVFTLMPAGEIFGGLWFFILFLAALTSSITMIQPAITFLEEAFPLSRRSAVLILFLFTFTLFLPVVYFNKDFTALDNADFWVGTIMIYILATIQIILFGWKIGAEKGIADGNSGSDLQLPLFFGFVAKYITPAFLIVMFAVFLHESLPGYLDKMNAQAMIQAALLNGESPHEAAEKANISLGVFVSIVGIFLFLVYLVDIGLKRKKL